MTKVIELEQRPNSKTIYANHYVMNALGRLIPDDDILDLFNTNSIETPFFDLKLAYERIKELNPGKEIIMTSYETTI